MRIKCSVSTGFVGSKIEETISILDEDIAGKSKKEIDEVCEQYYNDWLWDRIDTWWSVVEEEE